MLNQVYYNDTYDHLPPLQSGTPITFLTTKPFSHTFSLGLILT